MKNNFILITIIFSILITSCGGEVFLQTTPKHAIVSLYDHENKNYQSKGASPINLSKQILSQTKSGLVQLRISTENFLPTHLLFPRDSETDMTMNIQSNERENFYEYMQQATMDLYLVQVDIANGNNSAAQQKLAKYLKSYGFLAMGHVYQAKLDMMKNNKSAAQKNIKKALSIQPDNQYIQEMWAIVK